MRYAMMYGRDWSQPVGIMTVNFTKTETGWLADLPGMVEQRLKTRRC